MLPTVQIQLLKMTTTPLGPFSPMSVTRVRHLHGQAFKCWTRYTSLQQSQSTMVTLRFRYNEPTCQVNRLYKVMNRRWLASPSNNNNNSDRSPSTPAQKLQQKAANAKMMINSIKDKAIPTHENIYTIPNFLTFARLVSAPFIGYLIMKHDYEFALGIFALAGFTDLLDGYIARKYNLKTVVGSIIDPAADKALMTVMTVTLAAEGVLPMPLAALILGRDAGLVLAAFYYRYISLPKPKTLVRYFDFSIPSAEVRPTMISKVNTALQLVLMAASLTSTALGQPSPEIMTALHWTVGGTTIWSGASYIYSKDAVRILNRED
ncbi:CDP-alcohol phosphatidyltransferase-domain-containing protein [Phascolomyces articulosus]|uniref:CDP-alcohol phosphatidyltransferase-domain-containing protein n=1 Tax=Phascolomyces articulosus TaxID=60185 RepID=A0AAD5KB44_9FUNG|nr:CDP-alcohol phosphatidyltransferase-domain-containing protein [Phascolomyces articulosus]